MRRLATILFLLGWIVPLAPPASAVTHQATIGNYYYEDDQQHDQTKIVVRQGDQITFTVRQQAVPGHTVDVDALNIHSPNLNVGETFTTPRLTRTGNFYLYCRPHEDRGHHTRLVVLAAPKPAPTAASKPTARHAAASSARATPTSAPPSPAPKPTTTLTPVGVGKAPEGALSRPVPTNPNSVAALTGHVLAKGVPWTRSLWWLLIAVVPITGAAAVALRRARIAVYQPTIENVRRARARYDATPKRKPKPKPAKRTSAKRKR